MNKWEEALKDLLESEDKTYSGESVYLLQELVKRATPMKPNVINMFMGKYRGFCVGCGNVVTSSHNFCNYCGQCLDWSDK